MCVCVCVRARAYVCVCLCVIQFSDTPSSQRKIQRVAKLSPKQVFSFCGFTNVLRGEKGAGRSEGEGGELRT